MQNYIIFNYLSILDVTKYVRRTTARNNSQVYRRKLVELDCVLGLETWNTKKQNRSTNRFMATCNRLSYIQVNITYLQSGPISFNQRQVCSSLNLLTLV
jgi:hypothetical protein